MGWADLWQLSISVDKCCVLSVGKVDPIVNISLSGTALPHVTSCRDLGVTVSSDLSFSTHINNIVAKAHQCANAIHRYFISRNTDLLIHAYLTYVRLYWSIIQLFGHLISNVRSMPLKKFRGA